MGLLGSVHWVTLILVKCQGGNVGDLLLAGEAVAGGGKPHSLSVSPGWFKADAGVGHYLAMWPHPWHLKHWRECGSWHLATLPLHWACNCSDHYPGSLSPLPYSVGRLWPWLSGQGHPCHCGSSGNWGCSHHQIPIHSHVLRDYLGHWMDCCPVQFGSGQASIWQSADSAQLCPPLGRISLWP